MTKTELALTAFGVASSLGVGAAHVAAAIRAGISQAGPDVDAEVLDEFLEEKPITGHAATEITDGFSLLGRRACLTRAAVEDLLARLPAGQEWDRARVLFVVSAPLEEVFLEEPASVLQRMPAALLSPLTQGLGLRIEQSQVEVIPAGHAGAAVALRRAAALLEAGSERVLVIAVDSYLDSLHLELLLGDERLKHAENPVGFAPGEAAVAILVERPTMNAGAKVVAIEVSGAAGPVDDINDLGRSRALASCAVAVLNGLEASRFDGDLFVDLNGEPWRSLQWGHVLTELGSRFAGRAQLPAMSVGEVGAASGALGLLLASQSFVRRYARGRLALVLSASEDGAASCIAIADSTQGARP